MTGPITDNPEVARTTGSGLLPLLLILLAALIWTAAVMPAERRLRHQDARLAEYLGRVAQQRARAERLRLLKDGLVDDPQTVERELRRAGFGRPGDVQLLLALQNR